MILRFWRVGLQGPVLTSQTFVSFAASLLSGKKACTYVETHALAKIEWTVAALVLRSVSGGG